MILHNELEGRVDNFKHTKLGNVVDQTKIQNFSMWINYSRI